MADLEIALIADSDERNALWEEYYFTRWGMLANKHRQSIMEAFWNDPGVAKIDELLKDNEVYRKMIQTSGQAAASKAVVSAVNRLVAQEVVKSTIGGAVREGGRRGAVFAIQETAGLAAARGANVALTGVKAAASLGPAISSVVGEQVARYAGDKLGVTNHHAKNALNVGGGIVGGAIAGAFVGGPIGALAGAGVGVVNWGVGEAVSALARTTKGPKDNWCYCEIGSLEGSRTQLCFGTYNSGDTMYWKTYWNEYKNENSNWEMSAGQRQEGSFQLCIWVGGRVIKHLDVVYYRDRIRVVKKRGTYYVLHCKGQFHPDEESGTTKIYTKK